jgi:hypothetical protein
MTIRLVEDNQNRLFWRAGTGVAFEYCIPSAAGNQVSAH